MVKDGSKPGTIRAFRKYPVKAGDFAHLFYGMRTNFCTKLVDPSPVIREVHSILITKEGNVILFDTNWLDVLAREQVKAGVFTAVGPYRHLETAEKDELAWKDGFRHADDMTKQEGCFEMMCRFWRQTHELPFVGNHILWG